MRNRTKLFLLPFLAVLTLTGGLLAQVRIATVDLHRAIMETEDGQRARRRLEAEFANRQRELDAAQEELERMRTELEAQRNVLSREAYQQRGEEFQRRLIEVQRQYVEYQQELARHEAQLTQTIVERMQTILREIGTGEGYTVILDVSTGAVLFAPDAIDLTQTLIQRYNAQAPAVGAGGMDGDMDGDMAAEGTMTTMTTMTGMAGTMATPMAAAPATP